MRRAPSVETVSLLVEDTAASAVSGCDVPHAGRPPWAGTTATCAAKPSNPNSQPAWASQPRRPCLSTNFCREFATFSASGLR